MSELIWIAWTVLGVVFIIAEVFTTGFVLLWFGIGALVAAVCAMLGFDYPVQFLAFLTVSIALTVMSRTIFNRYFKTAHQDEGGLKSGVDALPGKVGTVVSSSRGTMNEGAVKVFGSTWTAYPADGEDSLEAGDRVVVERVQGASIYVRRADTLPGWRANELTNKTD